MKRIFIATVALVLFCGCTGTSARLNKVSLGMTKTEVVGTIGQPDSVSAKGDTEYLIYHWASPKQLFVDENNLDHYYIRLINGKVESYGEKGDFDSTKIPEHKETLDLNLK